MSLNAPKWARYSSASELEVSLATPAHYTRPLIFNMYEKKSLPFAWGNDSSKWWINLNKSLSKDARI